MICGLEHACDAEVTDGSGLKNDRSLDELAWGDRHPALLAAAHDDQLDRLPDHLLGHEPLQVIDAAQRDSRGLNEQVLGLKPRLRRRRSLDDLDNLDRAIAAEPGDDARR